MNEGFARVESESNAGAFFLQKIIRRLKVIPFAHEGDVVQERGVEKEGRELALKMEKEGMKKKREEKRGERIPLVAPGLAG